MNISLRQCTALIATLFTGTILATNHPAPNSWGISAEYLYLKPTLDDTNFVVQSTVIPPTPGFMAIGSDVDNEINYKSGFRVGLAYGFCECGELQALYSRLSTKQLKTVNGTVLSATRESTNLDGLFQYYSGSASSNLHLLYERLDVNFAQLAVDWCGLDLYFQFGLEGAYLNFIEDISYVSITPTALSGFVNERSRTWGIGPQIGFEIDYCLVDFSERTPGTISLTFLSSGSLLVGQNRLRFREVTSTVGVLTDLTRGGNTMIIPALHSRIGLKYESWLSGFGDTAYPNSFSLLSKFGFSLEVGYEFNSYFNSLSRLTLLNAEQFSLFTKLYNIDIQGFYASAMIAF